MFQMNTLKNRLKVITHYMPDSHGVTAGIFVGTGSRYENSGHAGISHFLEHMFFKGTKKRPTPADISRSIEAIGGHANAATSQDYTFFYNQVPPSHARTALEVLSDMINNSLFERDAITREKLVVLEELNMYLDTPSRYVYDILMNLTWPRTDLGRDVIGAQSSINAIQRQDILDYINANYQPQNTVVSVAGKFSRAAILKDIDKYFGSAENKKLPVFKKVRDTQTRARVHIHTKKTDQVHLALGVPSLPYNHKDEPALTLLDTILGSNMSSRLFLNIRERQGLCYSIHSFVEKFAETGLFGIAAGLNTAKINEAIRSIVGELVKLTKEKVSSSELDNAKEYLKGNLYLQMDSTDYMAIWYGGQGLFGKNIKTPERKIDELSRVKENDINRLAGKLFRKEKFNLAVIGPFGEKDEKRFLKLLN